MNCLRFIQALPLAAMLAWSAGCASHQSGAPTHTAHGAHAAGSSEARPAEISFENRVEANARFAAGVALELREERDRSLVEFYHAAQADWANEELVSDVARRLLAAKQEAKAVEILARCARRPETTAPLHALLGFAYRETGDNAKAIGANRNALRKQPDYLPAFQNIVQIQLATKHPDEARKTLDEAGKAVTSEQPETLLGLAETYNLFIRADPAQADLVKPKVIALLEKAASLDSTSPSFLARLAEAYFFAGEYGKASTMYLDLVTRVPNLPGLRERLIDAFMLNKDWKQAAEQLESIIRQNPGNARAYLILSGIAYEEKQLDRAADYLEKAILFQPDLEDAYYDLAGLKINMNKANEALDLIARARQQFKPKFSIEFYAGLARSQLKQYPEALKNFHAAEELARKDDPKRLTHFFYFQLGEAQERNKDFELAEESFRRCLEIQPDFAAALNYLGYMWAERGVKLGEAKKMIEKAVKQEPENAAYLDSMAWVLHRLKEHKQALDWMLKALKHTEEPDATLYDHLGDIYAAMNQQDQARDAWKKSLEIEATDAVKKKLETNSTGSSK